MCPPTNEMGIQKKEHDIAQILIYKIFVTVQGLLVVVVG